MIQFNSRKNIEKFIQKHPIYIIKLSCNTWSSYDISIYLDMLTEFHAFAGIKNVVTRITNQFLGQAGFLNIVNKGSKRKRPKTDSNKRDALDPYIAHSTSSTQSHASDNIAEEEQKSDYLTWWDPIRQTMFYIDPNTGTRFVSLNVDGILCI